jgi:hypothetical protein
MAAMTPDRWTVRRSGASLIDFKPIPRLEQVDDKRPKRTEHHKHRVDDALILPRARILSGPNFRGTTGVEEAACPERAERRRTSCCGRATTDIRRSVQEFDRAGL